MRRSRSLVRHEPHFTAADTRPTCSDSSRWTETRGDGAGGEKARGDDSPDKRSVVLEELGLGVGEEEEVEFTGEEPVVVVVFGGYVFVCEGSSSKGSVGKQ